MNRKIMKTLLSGMIVFSLFPKTAMAEEDVPQEEGSEEILQEEVTEDATEEITYSEEELPADEEKPEEELLESEITEPADEQYDSQVIEEEPVAPEEEQETEEEILTEETSETGVIDLGAGNEEPRSTEGYAYAILTTDNELIFFRSTKDYSNVAIGTVTDIKGNSYSGRLSTVIENEKYTQDNIPWSEEWLGYKIGKVRVAEGQTIKPVSMSYWFSGCSYLTRLDLSGFDTSSVTDMSYMFSGCINLSRLDLSSFDTSSVTDMSYMFSECFGLASLDLSGFDTSSVSSMSGMFSVCDNLTGLDLSSFDTSSVSSMSSMFAGCDNLTGFDLSSFDTSSVEDMSYMFYGCSSLTSLDLSGFDTSRVSSMSSMFSGCSSLNEVKLGTGFTVWRDNAYLPGGKWENTEIDKILSSGELYSKYSDNASEYAGTWKFQTAAYSVLTENGELIFFRSTERYSNNTTFTFTDINDNSYEGTVYAGIETSRYSNSRNVPWYNKRSSITRVKVAEGQTIEPISMSYWFSGCSYLTSLDLSGFDTSSVTDMSGMFSGCSYLTSLDLSGFDTSSVTDMSYMFSGCSSLTSLDLSGFDTSSVTDMSYMFRGCSKLTSLDLSGFDTSSVSSMSSMFSGCSSLSEVKLGTGFTVWRDNAYLPGGKWENTEIDKILSSEELYSKYPDNAAEYAGTWRNVGQAYIVLTEKGEMIFFRSTESYSNNTTSIIDIKGNSYEGTVYAGIETSRYDNQYYVPWYDKRFSIKTVKVAEGQKIAPVSLSYWFYGYGYLTSLDLSGFDTSSVTDMSCMFSGCSNLASLDLSNFDTSSVTDMSYMFSRCSSLSSLDLSIFDTSNVTSMSYMFNGCSNLSSLDLSNFDTSSVEDMGYMFYGCSSLSSLDLSSFDTSSVSSMSSMFSGCSSLSEVKLGTGFTVWRDNAYLPGGKWENTEIDKILSSGELYSKYPDNVAEYAGIWRISEAYAMLTEDGELIFFRSVQSYSNNATGTFTDINDNSYEGTVYAGIETSRYSYYENAPWYSDRSSIKTVKVAEGQTIEPVSMSYWFSGCSSLSSLDLSGIDTSSVTSMYEMFYGCFSLTSLDLSNFDTSSVTDMSRMFEGCSSLSSLDLSGIDTGSVTSMYEMFYGCSRLASLDLSSFDTSSVTRMDNMFSGCNNLKEMKLGPGFTKWDNNSYLPQGSWTNSAIGKTLTTDQFIKEYPANSERYSGTWKRSGYVTGVRLNKKTLNIPVGETASLTATVEPSDALNKSVSWYKVLSSPYGNNVEMRNNIVHAVKVGKSLIRVITNEGGYSDTCEIQVQFKDVTQTEKSFYKPVYWAVENWITTGTSDTHFSPSNPCTRAQFVTFLWRAKGLPEPATTKNPFTDVREDRSYYKAVLWAYENGITTGTTSTTFSPDKTCTRGQVATFLWRAMGKPKPKLKKNPFTDVKAGLSYSDAVLWAYENGITTGTSKTTFAPSKTCTRAQTVTFLYRTYNKE